LIWKEGVGSFNNFPWERKNFIKELGFFLKNHFGGRNLVLNWKERFGGWFQGLDHNLGWIGCRGSLEGRLFLNQTFFRELLKRGGFG